ncbi:MAG: aromatic ring-hydroxylating dioxygenase subunit alpha [Rubrivivax sp.]|uniref:aromatic ring-hydroxylating dioxygenase subunit alpha n=1 Tax=Ottowia sp. TaxID=1898956 RepID=UPI00217A80CA|nr:aromatic ring-hydroxylating dioxygenase subunit alpha [Ottowia sp.]MCC6813518.1 aromatic ring-hydroxylating dioxygenase subunit alpha [Rubrivivax sp.]HNR84085.1 aromatic ring-hydroxylating dioxygenase subunit alpha [Ottowia sp.]HNT85411.1 aromatic ring-hydroxylating dioxygenase subunit alpha [Ottowia sp.]HOZ92657.1 aromatic ring-hydroxylating dioxygenase subunit alpha [Ottowia sp.]
MNLERSLWHPVALGHVVGSQPRAVTLLGEDLVLWRDGNGHAHAWMDQCPHRGARLSLGRVHGGQLECPYHGWRFDGGGRCTHVPSVPDFQPGPRHGARTFDTREAYGMLWVRLAAPEGEPQPIHQLPVFAAEAEPRLRKTTSGPYLVAASAPRIIENFLDMAHFGYVHEGWLGSRERPEIPPYEVQATPHGVRATGCLAWQPRSSIHAASGAQVEYTYEVTAPYMAVLTKVPEAGSTAIEGMNESIAMFVCPVTEESSVAWTRMAMNDFDSPDARLIDFQNTIFGQDQPVLESQRPKRLPLAPAAEAHCAADRMSAAYRRYLRESGITFGVIP